MEGCARRRLDDDKSFTDGRGGASFTSGMSPLPAWAEHSVLMLDIGGGSCELTLSREGDKGTVSLKLGAVVLTANSSNTIRRAKANESGYRASGARAYADSRSHQVRARRRSIATSGTARADWSAPPATWRVPERAGRATYVDPRDATPIQNKLRV